MDTSDGAQPMDHHTPQDPRGGQEAATHTTNDVTNLTAQLMEAMAVVRALQQQNQAMGAEMRDMRAQMHEERMERRRYLSGEHDTGRGAQVHSTSMDRSSPQRQREPGLEEAREGATGHTTEHARTGNEGLPGGHPQGGQEQMRDEEEYEDEDEVDFAYQSGTCYSSKPFSTYASALGVRAVGKRLGSDHCALVQNGESPLPHKQRTLSIWTRVGQGIGNGWDPGPPVWDSGTPMNGLQTQRPHLRGSRYK